MANFIDSVAGLNDSRDKDELEVTLATVTFELVEASALILWRLVRRDGEIRLYGRVRLPSNKVGAWRDALSDSHDLPLLATRADLRACYGAGQFGFGRPSLSLWPNSTSLSPILMRFETADLRISSSSGNKVSTNP